MEQHDDALLAAVERVVADLRDRRTYVTGATGSRHRDEAIGDPYELPADRAYAESCAAIASFQLNWRLLLATGSVRYADAAEEVLYNALAASTAISGTEFFYSNPLHLRTGHDGSHEDAPTQRLPWYACACCPPNVARLLACAQDHVATASPAGLALHLFSAGTVSTAVGGTPVDLTVRTSYPWSGDVEVDVSTNGEEAWELALRIPSWCRSWRIHVAGEVVPARAEDGYVRVRRSWRGWSSVRLELDLPVRWIEPHPHVDAVRGCVALARGPVVHALEQADLPAGTVLEDLVLLGVEGPVWAGPGAISPVLLRARFGVRRSDGPLYRDRSDPLSPAVQAAGEEPDLVDHLTVDLVPYHRWANRGPGAMRVWLPTAP
ncbi:beta-L-arabinofuranosidase domain-containing protein [Kineococcus sp. NPDC059986]|uniref:glycoside hydrolase family 127 protein n=1 Tax=Kineococcus sp. NPDC059986 TaxID=3155538 RepID=UPI00344FF778